MNTDWPASDCLQADRDPYRVHRWLLFALGFLLPLFYLWRVQVGGDQAKLLLLGWEFYTTGTPPPYGTVLSHGGMLPGSLTGLLVGLPLYLSESYFLINVSILLFHVLAWGILDRTLRGILTPRERLLYTILYWLNPWRIYHSLFLWNPNWVFFFAAFHFWTLYRQRREASFLVSLLQVLSAGLLLQLHGSFLVLVLISVVLWLRGYQHIHWGGILMGVLLSAAMLYPWAVAVVANPTIRPTQSGFLGSGLVEGNPIRTVLYWIRLSSFQFIGRMMAYDYSPDFGKGVQAWLGPSVFWFNSVLGVLSAIFAAIAQVRLWRTEVPLRFGKLSPDASDREWLIGMIRWSFLADLVATVLSPVTVLHYQFFVIFHLAVLPLVFWLGSESLLPVFLRIWKPIVALCCFFILAQGWGSPMYRKGGDRPYSVVLKVPCPMLVRVGTTKTGVVWVEPYSGLMPDIIWLSETNHRDLSPDDLRRADERALKRMAELERRSREAGFK